MNTTNSPAFNSLTEEHIHNRAQLYKMKLAHKLSVLSGKEDDNDNFSVDENMEFLYMEGENQPPNAFLKK